MRTEGDTVFFYFSQLAETENLEAAGVSEDGARPRHEAVESAKLANLVNAGSQIEMIGIAQQDLYAQFFQQILGDALDAGKRANRHEYGGFNFSVRGDEATGTGGAGGGVNLEL